ncbi:Uncharacterized protein SCF082_LOCUS2028 [Durusdinium trenchii]|uniref:EGF-like domain-containing protein n=1 Tax=Durusdinium trenchii TaxID=1381693 RepID=A0ABP0HI80_9DINO
MWPLDWVWLGLSLVLAVGILLWTPQALRVDGAGAGFADATLKPVAWHRAAFQSLASHAAGIVGFAGFQYLVVAKILMTDPCSPFSLANVLLYITLALSIAAVMASCMFLCIDYMRRLAIDTARQKRIRVMVEAQKLEQTGLGQLIIILAGLMLLLYVLEIAKAACRDEKDDLFWYVWVLLRSAGGCISVALFYGNLRGLHESPKMHIHFASFSAKEEMKLADFLHRESPHGTWLPPWVTNTLTKFGGDDLALFANKGNRQALFPNCRFSPLLHLLGFLLFIGISPLGIHMAIQQLFVEPKLNELKHLSGTLAEVSPRTQASAWQLVGSLGSPEQLSRYQEFVFLLSSGIGKIQVTPEYRHTWSVRLCCENCTRQYLGHSLIKFHDKPLEFEVSSNSSTSTNCTLSLLGLSRDTVTNVSLIVVPKENHHLCDCSGGVCKCCEKFQGQWDFRQWNSMTVARLAGTICVGSPCIGERVNGLPGPKCKCKDSYFGQPKLIGNNLTDAGCTAARCDIPNSNRLFGADCACADGFDGKITWTRTIPNGQCVPAKCHILNSTKEPGLKCRCLNGFTGSIRWNGSEAEGDCTPAPCSLPNSTNEPGLSCRCREKYVGTISWIGSTPVGTCEPAHCSGPRVNGLPGPACRCKDGFTGEPEMNGDILTDYGCSHASCNIPNSTEEGGWCRCRDGFGGMIRWKGAEAYGFCKPAPCPIPNSNNMPGDQCRCLKGYIGLIVWDGPQAKGSCTELPCVGEFTNGVSGPGCRCRDGFAGVVNRTNRLRRRGEVRRKHAVLNSKEYRREPILRGHCEPAPCNVQHSNQQPGKLCKCLRGFIGFITWNGPTALGTCNPAPCSIENSNKKKGFNCSCLDGYGGNIFWTGWKAFGTCLPADCTVLHSDFVPGVGCKCLPGFYGQITWKGHVPQGECLPMPTCSNALIHIVSLKSKQHDLEGHACDLGQQLVLHGHAEGQNIRWTRVESKPRGRCKWNLSEGEPWRLFSEVSPGPPMECSIEAARPRCDSEIRYSITSLQASSFSCRQGVGHMPLEFPQRVEFRGRVCGYDLIQWESVKIPLEPESVCEIDRQGSPCGGIPHGEHLPHGCLHLAEPAVFEMRTTWFTVQATSRYRGFRYSVRFFDNGMASMCHGHTASRQDDALSCHWSSGLFADEWHLNFRMPAVFENGMELAFRRVEADEDNAFGLGSAFRVLDAHDENLILTSHQHLPSWWVSTFERDWAHDGNIEALSWQCQLSHFQNGTCYQVKVGVGLWISETSACGDLSDHVSTKSVTDNKYYTYARSSRGSQIYVSTQECLPLASRYELQVEVVSLSGNTGPVALEVASADTRCRKTLRFVAKAEDLSKCKNHDGDPEYECLS